MEVVEADVPGRVRAATMSRPRRWLLRMERGGIRPHLVRSLRWRVRAAYRFSRDSVRNYDDKTKRRQTVLDEERLVDDRRDVAGVLRRHNVPLSESANLVLTQLLEDVREGLDDVAAVIAQALRDALHRRVLRRSVNQVLREVTRPDAGAQVRPVDNLRVSCCSRRAS